MSDTPTDTDRTRDETERRGTTDRPRGSSSRDGAERGGRPNARETLNTDVMQWLSAVVALAGLGLVAAPFVFEATETAIWNDTVVGTGIFALAGYNFVRMTRDRLASVGIAALAVLLGLWALVSPAVIEMGSDELATSTAVLGLIAAALSAYNAYANRKADAPDHATHGV